MEEMLCQEIFLLLWLEWDIHQMILILPVVNNVETMAHTTYIFLKGYEEFRKKGTEDTPGTSIIALSGDIMNPGMYEISLGLTVRELLFDLGGGPRKGRKIKGSIFRIF